MNLEKMLIKNAVKFQLKKNKKQLVEFMHSEKIEVINIFAKKNKVEITTIPENYKINNSEQFINDALLDSFSIKMKIYFVDFKDDEIKFDIEVFETEK